VRGVSLSEGRNAPELDAVSRLEPEKTRIDSTLMFPYRAREGSTLYCRRSRSDEVSHETYQYAVGCFLGDACALFVNVGVLVHLR
jgi:hypothetical protein